MLLKNNRVEKVLQSSLHALKYFFYCTIERENERVEKK
ncbi:hypothetical protein BCW_3503 [Bacillus cereus W]|nr:hypothetical protein BAMEG_0989 [Bacillus anthracis str. CDC 684]ACQ50565.1 hypothetical protein BAA_3671 [Bacillus anthracis str. A0248]EDR86832.1 hypothetical protein BAQ_3677 [Bacillus anthracis str. A0193]EDS95833.1 hypothetical protein BAK_3730 [Bacillus anthracis str. A0389]EDT67255.1 hypothetical protein BAO_3635 [Bacillus anthracis str. A0174]EDV18234.1 hypothetical protein BATI_3513 [Bacillus anthracis str. Tsiankovskii-I]EDX57148.1 hypothetical protein BCW_3503 [Bacillus cereus W